MDLVGFVKEWGGHIMSALGIMGGLWAYFRHDKKLKSQERDKNEKLLREMRKSEEKELQAEIKACLISNGGTYKLRFINTGLSDAREVRVEIQTPKEELASVLLDEDLGPYSLINPNSHIDERIALREGHPKVICIKVTWNDAFRMNRTSLLSVPL
jgi:hypothetical protein